MQGEKTVSVGFRVTPAFKRLLDVAARHEHRTMTNLLEKLLTDHCRSHGLLPDEVLVMSPAGPPVAVSREAPRELATRRAFAKRSEDNENT